MNEPTVEELERVVGLALDNPIPKELHELIANTITAHTLNTGFHHDEAMLLINIAYPLIRDYHRLVDPPRIAE